MSLLSSLLKKVVAERTSQQTMGLGTPARGTQITSLLSRGTPITRLLKRHQVSSGDVPITQHAIDENPILGLPTENGEATNTPPGEFDPIFDYEKILPGKGLVAQGADQAPGLISATGPQRQMSRIQQVQQIAPNARSRYSAPGSIARKPGMTRKGVLTAPRKAYLEREEFLKRQQAAADSTAGLEMSDVPGASDTAVTDRPEQIAPTPAPVQNQGGILSRLRRIKDQGGKR